MITRTKTQNNYTKLNNTVLIDSSLSCKAKGLHSYLMSLPDDWKVYQSELVMHCSDGRAAVSSAMKELCEAGYAVKSVARSEDGKRLSGWDYDISDVKAENLISDNMPLLITNSKPITKKNQTPTPSGIGAECDLDSKTSDRPASSTAPEHRTKPPPARKTSKVPEYTPEFESAWKLYEGKGSKANAMRFWVRLSAEDRLDVVARIPAYIKSRPEEYYRSDFSSWINPSNRIWENKIITKGASADGSFSVDPQEFRM